LLIAGGQQYRRDPWEYVYSWCPSRVSQNKVQGCRHITVIKKDKRAGWLRGIDRNSWSLCGGKFFSANIQLTVHDASLFSQGRNCLIGLSRGTAQFFQLGISQSNLLFVKSVRLAVLNDVEDNDYRCENCVYANPNSSPKAYAVRMFVVGGIIFGCGIVIFGRSYLSAGKSRYAGFLVCVGWIIQFVGVGLISLGILALT
jgi:hypothetical protein